MRLVLLMLLAWPGLALSLTAGSVAIDSTFEIVRIEVTGCHATDAEAVVSMSGLRVGQALRLPGPQLGEALRRLWRSELFSEVSIERTRTQSDLIWLQIKVGEAPRVQSHLVTGGRKRIQAEWQQWLADRWPVGTTWRAGSRQALQYAIDQQLARERKPPQVDLHTDTTGGQVTIALHLSSTAPASLREVHFLENEQLSSQELEKAIGWSDWSLRAIRPNEAWLDGAREQLLAAYQQRGFADAAIATDTLLTRADGLHWYVRVAEGPHYRIGRLVWEGVTLYDTAWLGQVLAINPGDAYDPGHIQERLHFDPAGGDISSLYLDRGHLFFRAEVIETGLRDERVDLTIRVTEGPVATLREVRITGNERTTERVIRRELTTQPGDPFSRAAIIRSQHRLLALGYFDPTKMDVQTAVDPTSSTVDVTYVLEETRNDKFELAASLAPGSDGQGLRLLGTLGVTFNNFSLRRFLAGDWRSAAGDGQQLGLRFQSSGRAYQSYNFSFAEPWLGGRPRPLSLGAFHQRFASQQDAGHWHTLRVTGAQLGLGRRLPWGQGGWSLHGELGYQFIRLDSLIDIQLEDGTQLYRGDFNNLYLQARLNYQDLDDFFFPHRGSRLEVSGQWTPPFASASPQAENPGAAYQWLAYHKYRLSAEQYVPLGKRLTLRVAAKGGALFGYDAQLGAPPFERFEVGGAGTAGSNQAAFVGNDLISLRGYQAEQLSAGDTGGGTAFGKFTAELRYPVLNTTGVRGYLLAFAEAGNAWTSARDISWDLRRSAGLGLRLQLPMFGTIGFDYGVGFDREGFSWTNWRDFGQFNLILGFEPE